MTNKQEQPLCDCCKTPEEALAHHNPPGQKEIAYRIGRHSAFKRRMVHRLPRQRLPDEDAPAGSLSEEEEAKKRPMLALATRDDDDPAIALIDAWASAADVLAFYQERIANEGYLRTAGERFSVLELARAIGYELNPGVAAGTYLAFTVDETKGAPGEAEVPAGTQVQSIPTKQGELPQTFETAEDFNAFAEWNELKPRLSFPQNLVTDVDRIYLEGTAANISPGDRILLVVDGATSFKRVLSVKVDTDNNRTRILFAGGNDPAAPDYDYEAGVPDKEGIVFNADKVQTHILDKTWTEGDLQAFLSRNEWVADDLLETVAEISTSSLEEDEGAFAFRERAGIFGNSAPYFKSLPEDWIEDTTPTANDAVYPNNWDKTSGWQVWKDSLSSASPAAYYSEADLYLDKVVEGLAKDSWVVLRRPNYARLVAKVESVDEASITGFAMSSKVTAMELNDIDGSALTDGTKPAHFRVRKTVVYLKSEALELARMPDNAKIKAGDTELALDGMVLGLQVGQAVALTGEQSDAEGVTRSEILLLDEIKHAGGNTTLKFTTGLEYGYSRATVVLTANVVAATHGETVPGELLGGGDGAQAHQTFTLKKPPLTHISAATTSGAESTLEVRVNGIKWEGKDSLYGLSPTSRAYTVRIDNEANARVIFGDGAQGARLPTGQQNITAGYRSGIGLGGEVGSGSLSLLKTRPFGVKQVTNPVPASGAADPEKLEDARENAPITVLTLGRIVSLRDYENFTRAFAGIGKAMAVTFWKGEHQVVHITIADTNGDTISETADLYKNLKDAIDGSRDPLQEVLLGSYSPTYFNLEAKVLIDPDYQWETVRAEIESELQDTFAFEPRSFAQPVSAAEVVQAIHQTAGVVAVDLDQLQKVDEISTPIGPALATLLEARSPTLDPVTGEIQEAELLMINSYGITLNEMSA